jgi:hypothetical protein
MNPNIIKFGPFSNQTPWLLDIDKLGTSALTGEHIWIVWLTIYM